MQLRSKTKMKLKRRCTKIEKPLAEYKTVTDINLENTGSQFLLVFTETTLEYEKKNKIK